MLHSFRRATDLRDRCSLWYRRQAINVPTLKTSNETHLHCIKVLEEAYNILEPHCIQQEMLNDLESNNNFIRDEADH